MECINLRLTDVIGELVHHLEHGLHVLGRVGDDPQGVEDGPRDELPEIVINIIMVPKGPRSKNATRTTSTTPTTDGGGERRGQLVPSFLESHDSTWESWRKVVSPSHYTAVHSGTQAGFQLALMVSITQTVEPAAFSWCPVENGPGGARGLPLGSPRDDASWPLRTYGRRVHSAHLV